MHILEKKNGYMYKRNQKMLVNIFYFQTSMDLLYKIISNIRNFIYIAYNIFQS